MKKKDINCLLQLKCFDIQFLLVGWIIVLILPADAGTTLKQPEFFAFRHCQLISVANAQRQKGHYDPLIQLDYKKFLNKVGLIPNLHPKERELGRLMREHPPKFKTNTARQYLLPTPGQKLWAFGYAPALDDIKFLGVTKPSWYQASYNGVDGEFELEFKIDMRPLKKVVSKLSRDTAAEVMEWALFVSVPPNTPAKEQPLVCDEDLSSLDATVDKIHSKFLINSKKIKLNDECPVIARKLIRALGSRYLILVMGCKEGPTYQVFKLGSSKNVLIYTDSMKVD
jgi:hypothetical protein